MPTRKECWIVERMRAVFLDHYKTACRLPFARILELWNANIEEYGIANTPRLTREQMEVENDEIQS